MDWRQRGNGPSAGSPTKILDPVSGTAIEAGHFILSDQEQTGGGYTEIRFGQDFDAAFAQVADEQHGQYRGAEAARPVELRRTKEER